MSWKIILGKPGNTYIIGKRWIKKKVPKKNRIPKTLHKESCPGAIVDIGTHFSPESPEKSHNLWVCLETGEIFKKAPSVFPQPKTKIKKEREEPYISKPPIQEKKKPKPEPKPVPKPKIEPETEPVKAAQPRATRSTSIGEVKGIGKAAFEKLTEAGINTIGDLLKRHSQEIASLIGRKSDAQIKTWQANAQSLLKGE